MNLRAAIRFSALAVRKARIGLAFLLVASCKPHAAPASSPTAPPPPAKPTTSAAKSASKSELFVTRSFSISDDSGIYGFPKGTRVTLLKTDGDTFTVTDGIRTAKAPRTSFGGSSAPSAPPAASATTKAPAARPQPASGGAAPAASVALAADPSPVPIFSRLAEAKKKRHLEAQKVALVKKRERLTAEVADLTARIAAAENEASGKKSRQTARHYTYDSYGYAVTYSPTSAYSLSADASNIDDLRTKLAARKAELGALPPP